jgi:hypothetical protein
MEELRDIFKASADVRKFRRRHFLVNRNEVHAVTAGEHDLNRTLAALGAGPGFPVDTAALRLDEYRLLEPPVGLGDWIPVRTFALAFEYRRDGNLLDECHLRTRTQEVFDADEFALDHPHLHAVFVPNVCTFWHSIDHEAGHTTREIELETRHPLATFRRRLMESLATFPRPASTMVTDLRPYFGED